MPINKIKVYHPNGTVTLEKHVVDAIPIGGLMPLRTNRTYIQHKTKESQMYAKWMLAPSGFFVGVVEYENKHYYSYGKTADHLERNIKTQLLTKEHVSTTMVHLEQQRSESIDLQYATQKFISRYVKERARPAKHTHYVYVGNKKPEIKEEKKKENEFITEIDKKTGELVVYEMKEVARYKLRKEQ